jgi:hypothetical protein
MKKPGLLWIIAMMWVGLAGIGAFADATASKWDQPAGALADQIAGILGPGQAQLTIRNLSMIPASEIPLIRKLLEQDLKAHGVSASGAESANTLRVTLSENAREWLWVAEVIEGDETRVAMVKIQHSQNQAPAGSVTMLLRKEQVSGLDSLPCVSWPDGKPPVLAIAERSHGLLVLKQDCLLALDRSPSGFFDGKSFDHLASTQAQARDPRGLIAAAADGDGFLVFLPGTECVGNYAASPEPSRPPGEGWTLHCHHSDDPWPIYQNSDGNGAPTLKAFYNTVRNYFTGVVTPSLGVDLPPFYSAGLLPRPVDGAALLVNGVDGRVLMVENGALKTVTGTRDWGSDFAVLRSGCGGGAQVIAAGSGEAANDSLRAYELPALEAVPASAPLPMDGTVTAMWASPDGKSVFAAVRDAGNQYEVDRVTALCN